MDGMRQKMTEEITHILLFPPGSVVTLTKLNKKKKDISLHILKK
jgi:hypothetical protein